VAKELPGDMHSAKILRSNYKRICCRKGFLFCGAGRSGNEVGRSLSHGKVRDYLLRNVLREVEYLF